MNVKQIKNAAGRVKMTVLANPDGSIMYFRARSAAQIEASKHPNAKPSQNNFYETDAQRWMVRIYPA